MRGRPRKRVAQGDPLEEHAVQDEPGTILERRVSWWLRKHRWEYRIQVPLLGGRRMLGGTVVDHVLPDAFPKPKAMYAHGAYWHDNAASQEEDNRREPILAAMGYDVVIIPEAVILSDALLNSFLLRRVGLP